MNLKNALISIKDGFLDMLYPENLKCFVCGAELAVDTKYNICPACFATLPFNDKKVCLKCGAPAPTLADYCNRCQGSEFSFKRARAAFKYEPPINKLIYDFKFGCKKYLAESLGNFLIDTLLEFDLKYDLIVPVPLHKTTQKKRGFNQAQLLAEVVAKNLNGKTCFNNLVKTKMTSEQARLNKKSRAENLAGVFSTVDKAALKGRSILLIDDVYTTGATADECAKTLLKAGAKEVNVLVLAIVKPDLPLD